MLGGHGVADPTRRRDGGEGEWAKAAAFDGPISGLGAVLALDGDGRAHVLPCAVVGGILAIPAITDIMWSYICAWGTT